MNIVLYILNFAINWGAIYAVVVVITYWISDNYDSAISSAPIITTAIMIVSILFFMTDIGQIFMTSKIKGRRLKKYELDYLAPICREVVINRAKVVNYPGLIIQDNDAPNAMICKRAIYVTTGLLKFATPEEVAAVIAHEIGHLQNGDVRLKTIHYAINGVGSAILSLTIVITHMGGFLLAPFLVLTALLRAIYHILGIFAGMGIKLIDKHGEYKADEYAVNLGYKEPLLSFFYKLRESYPEINRDSLFNTHPSINKRIERVNNVQKTA